jgi:hypothetical protein
MTKNNGITEKARLARFILYFSGKRPILTAEGNPIMNL